MSIKEVIIGNANNYISFQCAPKVLYFYKPSSLREIDCSEKERKRESKLYGEYDFLQFHAWFRANSMRWHFLMLKFFKYIYV